jgi:hypothetical protein
MAASLPLKPVWRLAPGAFYGFGGPCLPIARAVVMSPFVPQRFVPEQF